MKSRTVLLAIALVASLLLVVSVTGCGGGASRPLSRLIARQEPALPVVTQFLSRQAPMAVSLLVRPDRLYRSFPSLPLLGRRDSIQQEWSLAKSTLSDWTGLDYEADLQPWLGSEVSFAVTHADLDYDSTNGLQAGYLVVLRCRDGQKAREALYELWQKRRSLSGHPLVFETISGVSLVHDRRSSSLNQAVIKVPGTTEPKLPVLATAAVGDRYVLLANHPAVLRQAIAAFQAPDISLARDNLYQEIIYAQPANRVGWFYANVPQFFAWLGVEPAAVAQSFSQSDRALHCLLVSLRAAEIGLRGETAAIAAPGTQFVRAADTPPPLGNALQSLPENTLFVSSGPDLSNFLENIKAGIGGYPVSVRLLQQLLDSLSLPTLAELSLLLDAFQGDYALALIDHTPPSWVLLSPAESGPNWTKLDSIAQQRGLTVNHIKPTADQEVVVWSRLSLSLSSSSDEMTNLEAKVIGVHTQGEDYEVFSTSLLGLEAALGSAQASGSLTAEPAFVETLNELELESGNVVYVNWRRLSPFLVDQFPLAQAVYQLTQPLTAHLSSTAVTGFATGDRTSLREGMVAVKLVRDKEEPADL